MTDKIITLLVGVLIALGGWTLTRTFDLSTNQAVNNDKVNKLERYVEKLQNQMDDMMDKDKEIMQQHENLFKALQKDDKPTGSYNY
jgi:thiamine kinase-like enzyme